MEIFREKQERTVFWKEMEIRKKREKERKGTSERKGTKKEDRRGCGLIVPLSNKLLSICRPDPPPRTHTHTHRFSFTHTNPPLYTLILTTIHTHTHTHFVSLAHTYTLHFSHTKPMIKHTHTQLPSSFTQHTHTQSNYSSQWEKKSTKAIL